MSNVKKKNRKITVESDMLKLMNLLCLTFTVTCDADT